MLPTGAYISSITFALVCLSRAKCQVPRMLWSARFEFTRKLQLTEEHGHFRAVERKSG